MNADGIDSRTAPYAALLLRVSLGALFLAHAGLKLFVFTPAGADRFFASLGMPGWAGLVVIAAEIIAGMALIVGIHARAVALVMILDLLGAIALVHIHNGFFFTAKGGGYEYPLFWAIALAVLALAGDGAWAVRPGHTRHEKI